MTDMMDDAVINMPIEMAMQDALSRMQYYRRAQSILVDRNRLQQELAASQERVKALEDLMAELNKLCAEKDKQIQRAGVAYETGRDAGLEEAAAACTKAAVFNAEMGMMFGDDEREERTYHAACNEADHLTDQINALKSDAKGGV